MSGFLKKLIATGAVFTIGLSSVAMADRAIDPACCPPPPCNPCGNWCDNLSFYGAWLYWKVNCDELEYAVVKTSDFFTDTLADHETFHDVKCDWDSGFRIGVAFDVPDCCWGIDLNWTHFDSSSSDSKFVEASNSGSSIVNVGLPSLIDFTAVLTPRSTQSVDFRGTINFRYNTVDLEFGRWINFGNCCLLFRPHIGLRYADINETWKNSAECFNGAEFNIPNIRSTAAEFHAKNKFHGLGVRVGFDADLRLCDGWSLVGRSAISLISGRTHLKQTFDFDIVSAPNIYNSEIKENYRQKRAIADLAFGLRYKTLICDCYPAFIELTWEHHYLWAQHRFWVDNAFRGNDDENQTPETTSGFKKTGDLAVQGLTLTLGLCF